MALEFDMAIDTKIFCEKLREVPKGEVITFEELGKASRLKKATSLAHMGAIEQATGIKKYKKVLDEAFNAGIPPSPAEVFEEYVNAKKKYN